MSVLMIVLYIFIGLILGLTVGIIFIKTQQKTIRANAQHKANQILKDAKHEALQISNEAKHKAQEIISDSKRKSREAVEDAKREFERSQKQSLDETKRLEERAKEHEKQLREERRLAQESREKAESLALKSEKALQEYERQTLAAKQAEEHFRLKSEEIKRELEKVAGMTQKEAMQSLIKNIEDDAKLQAAKQTKLIEENAKEEAERLAKRIISISISRYSSEYVSEHTTTSVTLPSDELKGRLIGREGRNIRALEAATGCDLIVDDTPETVVVSCFDPVRRHVGKLVLEQLIADGRIHPTRIEEMVEKVNQQVKKSIREAGEAALLELGIVSMHKELINTIGQLQFRYSYSQNQYHHVIEVGHLCGLMAAELGLDVKKARRAGLLHDIGKALTHEIEGSHAVIGADLCEKHGEEPDVVYAVRAHHDDVKPQSWLDYLVIGADALSGARPGARREQMDNYIRRLKDLEQIAGKFPGVERTFAINAGREIRVMVENSRINDEQALMLSRDIAKEIEGNLTYPGQIKVTVIRETRATTFAK